MKIDLKVNYIEIFKNDGSELDKIQKTFFDNLPVQINLKTGSEFNPIFETYTFIKHHDLNIEYKFTNLTDLETDFYEEYMLQGSRDITPNILILCCYIEDKISKTQKPIRSLLELIPPNTALFMLSKHKISYRTFNLETIKGIVSQVQ